MSNRFIHAEIERNVIKFPNQVALEGYNLQLTYQELNNFSNQLSYVLLHLSSQGSRIGVYASGGPLQVVSLLAILKAGMVYVPTSPDQAINHILQVIDETSSDVIITTAEDYSSLRKILLSRETGIYTVIVIDQLPGQKEQFDVIKFNGTVSDSMGINFSPGSENPGLNFDDGEDAYIFYTSGSSGKSKAIVGSHIALSHYVHWHKAEWKIDNSFRISQVAPMTFDASLKDIFTALISGATLCLPNGNIKNNPIRLMEWLRDNNITLLQTVPSVFRLLTTALLEAKQSLPVLRYVVLAGERLFGRDVINWRMANGTTARLSNMYGLTETTILKTCFHIDSWDWQPGDVLPVGFPISNTLIAVVNSSNNICEVGELGEVYIKSPYISKGYLDKSLNSGNLVQNPLTDGAREDLVWKTGDLGRYREDGSLEILGRRDEQIKINGVRIELEQVRKAILKQEGITRIELLVHNIGDTAQALVCYYTGKRYTAESLRQLLSDDLNSAMLPSYYVWMETFPLNLNGKVDRKALPKPEEVVLRSGYQPPKSSLEEQLAVLWQQVLGQGNIGRNDNFFNIGGSSLKAIQLIAKIYKEIDVQLSIADLFDNPVLSKLAELIEKSKKQSYSAISKVPESENYLLSSSQKRVWVASQLKAQSIAYNIPILYRIQGGLNISALSEAFRLVIERHESLRTTFLLIDGEPRQRILSPIASNVELVYRDFRDLPDSELAGKQRAHEIGTHYFDLETGPLFLIELIQISDDGFLLAGCIHHIIADEWSMQVMANEITKIYNAYIEGSTPKLPELNIQYKDYAFWQQKQLDGSQLANSRRYWLSRFAGDIPVLELPSDRSRPAMQSFRGSQFKFTFDPDQTLVFQKMLKAQESTLFIGLLTLVNTLLFRYSGQNDLVVGTPVAGRNHPDLEDQIGYYLNTLAIRNTINGNDSFLSTLERTRRTTIDAFSNQEYPFDLLIEELKLDTNLSRSPLFDVVIILQNIELNTGDQLEMQGVEVDVDPAIIEISKCDLRFQFSEDKENGILYGSIEYNTDLFDRERIERMARHLTQLLNFVSNNPHVAISATEYLSDEEKMLERKALNTFNSTIEENF
ncbi:condensation domain-containing protein [Sphingobacterium lactis]|uniref:condensation domain-containing protein n=1 Tax=Sphingobacterium TaxID=28453 RepID=UPI0021A68A72|nr:condensation domain-containing protein [Sphingobacterium hotanense]MCT1526771.1 condensation domain-containing protein [Sphingobacterium hotanense]